MSVGSARTLIPVLAILAFAAALGWYFSRERAPAPQVPPATAGAPSAPAEAQLAQPAPTPSVTAPQQSAALPSPADVARPAQPGPAGSDQARAADQPKQAGAAEDPKLPSFDVVRVEPTGESVIAGRASPGATVELLRNGQSFARVIADASGLFAFVPPPLPPGSHEVVLQANTPDGGGRARSAQSVTVVIAGDRKQTPLVTVTAPDQPTIILSRPDEPSAAPAGKPPAGPAVAPAAPAVASAAKPEATPARPEAQPAPAKRPEIRIATVEAEGTGRLFVSGQAAPGATIRLYLNDAFVAPSGTGPDGRLSFSIERGIRPGDYRVRLDDVDPVTGAVKSRAEVPFTVPAPPPVAVAGAPVGRPTDAAGSTSRQSPRTPDATAAPADRASPAGPVVAGVQPAAPASTVPSSPTGPGQRSAAADGAVVLADPGQVVVPEVNTAIVARGDNLWRISKRVYGQGLRYTVIYGANTPQIRNPDLIYPGQVFVLPADSAQTR
jgi:nucleoid-associated protein YgaU